MRASAITRELIFWADFNSVDAGERITTSLRFAKSPERPQIKELVLLYDGEGNSVRGTVEEIRDLTLVVRPHPETWRLTEFESDPPVIPTRRFRAMKQDPRSAGHATRGHGDS